MKFVCGVMVGLLSLVAVQGEEKWLSFAGKEGPGKGKKVVLVSGDEEYRSEETMPMLAKILSARHGFDTVVLFSWSADGKYIDPNHQGGVIGWEQLDEADMMIIGTRMRVPSDEAIDHMTKYLDAGKPVIGFRTATHAFLGKKTFGSISANDWGLKVLGERWVNHHGRHKVEGARGIVEKERDQHPILNSVKDVFGPSDVYGVKHLTDRGTILMRGAVTETLDPGSKNVEGTKNNPMMPLAWLHTYTSPSGEKTGRAFCTTMGASVDFVSEDLRRLLVNAVYYLFDIKVPEKVNVDYVDQLYPSFYGFWRGKHAGIWKERGLVASDFGLGKVVEAVEPPKSPKWEFRPMKK